MTQRAWASAVCAVAALCLIPTAFVTWQGYSYLWKSGLFGGGSPSDPFLATAPPIAWLLSLVLSIVVCASIVGGPLLIVLGAARAWAGNATSPSSVRMVFVGGTLLSAWSMLWLAVWPPDSLVRMVAAAMAVGGLFVLVTAWRRRSGGLIGRGGTQ